jgi:hypothetical protein
MPLCEVFLALFTHTFNEMLIKQARVFIFILFSSESLFELFIFEHTRETYVRTTRECVSVCVIALSKISKVNFITVIIRKKRYFLFSVDKSHCLAPCQDRNRRKIKKKVFLTCVK